MTEGSFMTMSEVQLSCQKIILIITSHAGRASLAILPWVRAMRTAGDGPPATSEKKTTGSA